MAIVLKEIYSYFKDEASLLSELQSGQRAVDTDGTTTTLHGWVHKLQTNDFIGFQPNRYYDDGLGAWNFMETEYSKVTAVDMVMDTIQDKAGILSAPFPLTIIGTTALVGFTAAELVPALNELKAEIGAGPSSKWTTVNGPPFTYVKPNDVIAADYVHVRDGFVHNFDETKPLPIADVVNTELLGTFPDPNVIGALNHLKTQTTSIGKPQALWYNSVERLKVFEESSEVGVRLQWDEWYANTLTAEDYWTVLKPSTNWHLSLIDNAGAPNHDHLLLGGLTGTTKLWLGAYSGDALINYIDEIEMRADEIWIDDGQGVRLNLFNLGGGTGTPAGSDKEIQFNDGGSFGAESNFIYNKVDVQMTIQEGDHDITFVPNEFSDVIFSMHDDVGGNLTHMITSVSQSITADTSNDLVISNAGAGTVLVNTVELIGTGSGTLFLADDGVYKSAGAGGGTSFSFNYKFQTTIGGSPGNGKVRYDNADPTLVTHIHVDALTDGGSNVIDALELFDVGDLLTLLDSAMIGDFHHYEIVSTTNIGVGDYIDYEVIYLANSVGLWSNNQSIIVYLEQNIVIPGSDTEVFFNQLGVIGADSEFTFDYTNKILTVDKFSSSNFISIDASVGQVQVDNGISFLHMTTANVEGIGYMANISGADMILHNFGTGDIAALNTLNIRPVSTAGFTTQTTIYNSSGSAKIDMDSDVSNQLFFTCADAGTDSTITLSQPGSDNLAISVAGGTGYVTINTVRLRTDMTAATWLDGTGVYTFPPGDIGGLDTYVQFNDGGAHGGDAGFTFLKGTTQLTQSDSGSIIKHIPLASGTTVWSNWDHGSGGDMNIQVTAAATTIFTNHANDLEISNLGAGTVLVNTVELDATLAATVFLNGTGVYSTPAGGASTFLALTDTPSVYTDAGNAFVVVNDSPNALIFQYADQVLLFEDWEGGTFGSWTTVNDGTNDWIVSATANLPNGSTYSAYISNGAGANTYSHTSQTSHMYIDIAIPSDVDEVEIEFDYECDGENSSGADQYDFMRVFISEDTSTPVAGTLPTTGFTRIGEGKYNLVDGEILHAAHTLTSSELSSHVGDDMRLTFTWTNDSAGGSQPPANVDNIKVTGRRRVGGLDPNIIADFYARKITDGSLTSGFSSAISFPRTIRDSHSNWDGTNTFTINEPGYYDIIGSLEWTTVSGGQADVRIVFTNGGRDMEQSVNMGSSATFSEQVSFHGYLTEGTTFQVTAQQFTGSSATIKHASTTGIYVVGRRK